MSESAPRISDEAVEVLAKRLYVGERWFDDLGPEVRADWTDKAQDHLTAILPLLCGGLEEELKQVTSERDEWKGRTEPDTSPGDVIAAEPDGTITLDDGITTWNPERASRYLVSEATEKAEQELEQVRVRLDAKLKRIAQLERATEGTCPECGYDIRPHSNNAGDYLIRLQDAKTIFTQPQPSDEDRKLRRYRVEATDDRHVELVQDDAGGLCLVTDVLRKLASQPQQPECSAPECETPGCTCPESNGQPNKERHAPGCLYGRAIEVLEREGPEGWEGHPPGHNAGPLTAAEVESVSRVVEQLKEQQHGEVEEDAEPCSTCGKVGGDGVVPAPNSGQCMTSSYVPCPSCGRRREGT